MARIKVQVPVTVEITEEQLEGLKLANDVAGVIARTARNAEVRAVAKRVADLVRRKRQG